MNGPLLRGSRLIYGGALIAVTATMFIGRFGDVSDATTSPSTAQALRGGVKEAPLLVSADHTPFAVAVSVQGLRAGERYALKVRLRSNERSQFGATWNPATRKWCSAAAPWASQTTVTPSLDGVIGCWLAARAGSKTSASEEGTAQVGVVLRQEGTALNLEAPLAATITVLTPGAAGSLGWVHGSFPDAAASEPVQVVLCRDSLQRIVGTALIEPNGVDDDDNGVVDDESWDGVQARHSFRLAVPAGRLISLESSGRGGWLNQAAFAGLDLRVPRAGTSLPLQLAVTPATADWMRAAYFSGRLGSSTVETVAIERSFDGRLWSSMVRSRTQSDGGFGSTLRLSRSARYRAVWLGRPDCPATLSRPVFVGVRPIISARLGSSRVRCGGTVWLCGTLRPAAVYCRLSVWLRAAGCPSTKVGWVPVRKGRYSYRLKLRRPGRCSVWVRFSGDRRFVGRYCCAGRLTVGR